MSVSQKFLGAQESLPSDVVPSIGDFMAFVHNSSTEMSKNFLNNDKRYNYTTPKTFLGFISLSSKLLSSQAGRPGEGLRFT